MPKFGRCDICLGRGTINLPVYRETVAAMEPGPAFLDAAVPMEVGEGSRSYPCPECAKPNIPLDVGDRFTVIRANTLINPDAAANVGYMQSLRGGLAHRIAQVMLKSDCITFAERRSPRDGGMFRPGSGPPMVMEAVAGIVWPEGREIERIIENFDPVFNDGSRSGGGATSGRNDYAPKPWEPGWRGPGSVSYDPDPDIGLGVRRSQAGTATEAGERKKKPAPIKLQRNPGRELIFEDEVNRNDEGQ